MRKATLLGIAAVSLAFISTANAQTKLSMIPGEVSATAALTTDYVFRGLSQSDGGPAVQGSFDYSYKFMDPTSLYLGVWGSNVDFDDGDEANIEIDFTGGLKGMIGGFSWQLGGIYYYYPGAEAGPLRNLDYDYVEGLIKIGYDFGFLSASVNANYSPEYFSETGDGLWIAADVTVPTPLPLGTALTGHIGRQKIDNNARFGTPDYTEWAIGVTASIEGFNLGLTYADTDLKKSECFVGTGLSDSCEGRVFFTVSRTF